MSVSYTHLYVAKVQEVTLNFYDEPNNNQVKEETITLPADATHVNLSLIHISPPGSGICPSPWTTTRSPLRA